MKIAIVAAGPAFNLVFAVLAFWLMFLVGITSLLVLAWEVTLVCLVFCFLVGFVTYLMFQVMRPFWKLMRRDRAEISGRLTEVFSGKYRLLKYFR